MSDPTIRPRILVVEDSATLRYILGKSVQKHGYELLAVDSFQSALDTLQNVTQNLHGVIIGWPNYEYFEDSKHLLVLLDREPYSELPVILLSNDAEMEILNWMSTRQKSAMVPWENYQEAIISLQNMLAPSVHIQIENRRVDLRPDSSIRILFVDDSSSIRTYYKRLLERNGYIVETASSVKLAYEIAKSGKIDIAIVDYFMPDENGYVLCQKLRDDPDTEGVRTAVLTGTYLDKVIRDCLQAGAIECMFKNEAEELFLARISAMKRFIEVQRSIEDQRERLAAILESVGEGVYGVDNDGRITFVNPATLKVLGLDETESIIGESAYEIFHFKDDKSQVKEDRLQKAYTGGIDLRCWETRFTHITGKAIPVECTIYPLRLHDKQEGSVIAFRDISNRKMLEQKLKWLATHDHLTKLYNRRYFEARLENEIRQVQRTGIKSALVYLDLDRFKYVNDAVGHAAGDRLLVDISRVLVKQLRRNDVVARIGGDEFALIFRNVDSDLAIKLSDDIRLSLSSLRINDKDQSYHVHASLGVALLEAEVETTAGDVLANADIACHMAKRSGRNQTHLYKQDSDERNVMGSELGWSARIREALETDGFRLSYQPIIHMDDIDFGNLPAQGGQLWRQHTHNQDNVFQYEVLVRMPGDNGKIFFPETFIPTAERFNMMIDIDMWVLEHALQDVATTGRSKGKIVLSINLSGHTLDDDAALSRIKEIITKTNISPNAIIFEVTETIAISNLDQANHFIDELRAIGCQFSLDDFGSGFCSFSQLKNLQTDYVKIDGQFVKNMARGATDRAIVTAMNDVAHSLGRSTVAEYVESPEIARLLKICGVDKLQGNYISRPLKALPHGNIIRFDTIKRKE